MCVLTIGNFDGVHIGHRAVFNRVVSEAKSRGVRAVCLSFDPHPLRVIRPDVQLLNLFSRVDMEAMIKGLGVDQVKILPFDHSMAALSAPEFFERHILPNFLVSHFVAGYDFVMGRGRQGDIQTLRELGIRSGFTVEKLEPVLLNGTVVSSTLIRDLIQKGDVGFANKALGRPFYLEGGVVRGDGRGRMIGFPTANVGVGSHEILPGLGVYVSQVEFEGELRRSVTNVGVRPTFGNHGALVVETHILDWQGDLYGSKLKIELLARLRGEVRFSSREELMRQIHSDVAAAREYNLGHG